MFWSLMVGCGWFADDVTVDVPPPLVLPVDVPPFPSPPRVGVAELAAAAGLILAEDHVDVTAPTSADVWVDADRTTFEDLGKHLEAWGVQIVDGDGEVWRVRADDGLFLSARLAAAPGVLKARDTVAHEALPSGAFREGSARFGTLVYSWAWREGGPTESFVGGPAVPKAELPRALPAGARFCFGAVLDQIETGVVKGPGWERALVQAPASWAVLFEDYGPCKARGWIRLTADAPVADVTVGGRLLVDADDVWFHDLAIEWLGSPRGEDDPAVMNAVAMLAQASDATLARAMRDVAPSTAQSMLYDAFASRDPEAALAVAGGSNSPILRVQAVGQDEGLRASVLADPHALASDLYAAVIAWRPSAADPPGLVDRLFASSDPRVRARAHAEIYAASAASCAALVAETLDLDAARTFYRDCPAQRTAGLARLRTLDANEADAALARTVRSPETVEAGIAAVRAAGSRPELLREVVASRTVSRDVRAVALTLLLNAGDSQAAALQRAHGAFLGVVPPGGFPIERADAGAPAVASPEGQR